MVPAAAWSRRFCGAACQRLPVFGEGRRAKSHYSRCKRGGALELVWGVPLSTGCVWQAFPSSCSASGVHLVKAGLRPFAKAACP